MLSSAKKGRNTRHQERFGENGTFEKGPEGNERAAHEFD